MQIKVDFLYKILISDIQRKKIVYDAEYFVNKFIHENPNPIKEH